MSNSVVKRKCVLCDSENKKLIVQIDSRKISSCNDCGMQYASEFNRDDIKSYYNDKYYGEKSSGRTECWIAANKAVYHRLSLDCLKHKAKIGKLLDIGAGTGAFLIEIAARSPQTQLYATESSADACKSLSERFKNITVINSEDFIPSNFADKLDVVTMFQTLEHVENPGETLKNAFSCLAPGGMIFITVPNRNSWQRLFRGMKKALCYTEPTHIQFFDILTLEIMLKNNGFTDIKRIVSFGGYKASFAGLCVQFAFRMLGISNEVKFIAFKPI